MEAEGKKKYMKKGGKKIGVITPMALERLEKEYAESFLANINYLTLNADKLPFELLGVRRINPSTVEIAENRNECIAWAKKWDCDITVWFDADQDLMNCAIQGSREPDVLFRLLKDGYEHPIYAGIYYLKKPPFHPVIFKSLDNVFEQFSSTVIYPEKDLFYADMIGMGCCKIDMDVIRKLDAPYFKYKKIPKSLAGMGNLVNFKYENGIADISEDVYFWQQVKEKTDYKIVVDPNIQVGHITKAIINRDVFNSHFQGNMELAKQELGGKFNEYWEQICQAEPVKKKS